MSFLAASVRRGEYCATCLSVLSCQSCEACGWHSLDILFCDAVERGIIVEAKVTGVDDVVGFCLTGEVVQGPEVAFIVAMFSL